MLYERMKESKDNTQTERDVISFTRQEAVLVVTVQTHLKVMLASRAQFYIS